MRGEDARIGGQRCGRLNGVAALCAHVFCASMVGADKGRKRGAARALGRCEGGPAPQNVTENGRIFLLKPVEYLRERVLQGPGEAVRPPPLIPDHAPTTGDELCAGAPGRALRREWLQLLPMRAPQCELQCGGAGIVLRSTGGEGFALSRQ